MKNKLKSIALITLTLIVLAGCKKEGSENSLTNNYQSYIKEVDNNVSSLSPERKNKRKQLTEELKNNSVYIALVDKTIVSENYLATLSTISDAIKNSYLEDGNSVFGISDELAAYLEKSKDGSAKMDFVVKVSLLSLKMNGGMPKEIVMVFDEYRKKFNLYGKKGDLIIGTNGLKVTVEKNYNLTYAFAMFDPTEEKVLDALFESVNQGISDWSKNNDVVYDYSFMSSKSAYMKHLKDVYPSSPYLLDVDFEISPNELYANYRANEVAADEKFRNKKLALTGQISDIGKDITDKPYISFKVGSFENVTCYFDSKNSKLISELSKGDTITIVGTCSGLILTNVILKDSSLY